MPEIDKGELTGGLTDANCKLTIVHGEEVSLGGSASQQLFPLIVLLHQPNLPNKHTNEPCN